MAIASLLLLMLLLALTHTLITNYPIRTVTTRPEPDGTESILQVEFYQTNLGYRSFVLAKANTGMRIDSVEGRFAQDTAALSDEIDTMISMNNRTPLRRDTLIPNLIAFMRVLIPIALAALFLRYLRRERRRLAVSNQCLNCAYSLDGIDQFQCPECGQHRP